MGVPVNILDIPPEREQQEVMDCIPCGYHRYYYNYDVFCTILSFKLFPYLSVTLCQ